jgi:hypothetical protein
LGWCKIFFDYEKKILETINEITETLDRALEIAEYKTLKQKAMLNQTVVQSDENGNIIYIPAREVFTKLYNEPVPEF